jgi:6-pyruvoyltetrahydropterin/6-carboxytetrahydropterin synthase
LKVIRRVEFAAAHRLSSWYTSKCFNMHGHNWIMDVTFDGAVNPHTGAIIDFTTLGTILHEAIEKPWDHQYLNEVEELKDATCEVLAYRAWLRITKALLVVDESITIEQIVLEETPGNSVRMDKYDRHDMDKWMPATQKEKT